MSDYVLALDQGTTSSRAILFDRQGQVVAAAQEEFPQILPGPGLVEHDPEAIWTSQRATARDALGRAGVEPDQIAAIGIANQRETTILWDRHTGKPLTNAIVWQSRVSAPICERLHREGFGPTIAEKTGLLIDPYFSGTKITYLLDQHPEWREGARRGEILFGTVDSFLLWRLTGGRVHATDLSNASRTLLLNIQALTWDDDLLEILDVPREMLPEIVPTSGVIGPAEADFLGSEIPVAAIAGDQQAATFGQVCFEPRMAKNTYGTGCFLVMNTGSEPVRSEHGLLTTVGWQLDDQVTYCLEGAIFIAGAAVQWLRDGLGLIRSSSEIEALAVSVPDSGGVYFVPALAGLGSPHWDPNARGTLVGLTRGTTSAHLARAVLDAIALQSCDVLESMARDIGSPLALLNVDGGATANDLLLQIQADLLGVPVRRPVVAETTALGAAYLAGLAVGFWESTSDLQRHWVLDRQFEPAASEADRQSARHHWQRAVERSLNWIES